MLIFLNENIFKGTPLERNCKKLHPLHFHGHFLLLLSANEQSNWDDNKFSLPHNFPFFFSPFVWLLWVKMRFFTTRYTFLFFWIHPHTPHWQLYLSAHHHYHHLHPLVNVNIFSFAAFKARVFSQQMLRLWLHIFL